MNHQGKGEIDMAYKSRKSGKRNHRSGGHKHFDKVGVKEVPKLVVGKEEKK